MTKDEQIKGMANPNRGSVGVQEAQLEQEPCDMGVMCAGCTPRNLDGSCPAAQPEPVQTRAVHITWNSDGIRTVNGVPDYTPPAAQSEQEPVCDKDPQGCWNVRCQLGKKCKNTPPAAQPEQELVASGGWLQEGSLLYRLTDEHRPSNRDEINVTMVDGSRSIESRTRRAGELLDRICATPPAAQPQRTWGGLTVEQIGHQAKKSNHEIAFALGAIWAEARLKEKNT